MRERDLFIEALQKGSSAERLAYLGAVCAGDDALRRRVLQLLAEHEKQESFLLDAPPLAASAPTADLPAAEQLGTMIGPYKLLEQIGEGGFGVVYLAEQTEPVRRKVALKILKPGMDTRQIVARFEAERQALAIMDHPNIAKVFDGGSTEVVASLRDAISGRGATGLPYFVMELVKGIPITEYCDQNHLTPRQRLELFIPVCQAVQHAHQKGIIHRDLKPSNVLVTRHDSTAVPKVIDFGVAKALGQELTDKTLHTGIAQMIGTPLYMSPEQAGMSDLDVDTRSDIYSLGVLLYELLTGTTPFEKDRFKQAAYDEIRRIIREEDPPKPSTRLSDLSRSRLPGGNFGSPARQAGPTSSLASVSALRQTGPAKLTKLVRGELDWIVMKALEKNRNRRYESASAFAMDLHRYLADEPVQAGPPSQWYRIRKFTHRNKRSLATLTVVAMATLLVVCSLGWVIRERMARRNDGERRAQDALAEAIRRGEEENWFEALGTLQRDEDAQANASPELREQFRTLRVDFEMARRLEAARLGMTTAMNRNFDWDYETSNDEFAAAFKEYGLNLESREPGDVATQIRARPIGPQLTAGLEVWACLRRKAADKGWRRLLVIAREADPDPWRNRLRDILKEENKAKARQALQSLVASAPTEDWPSSTLGLLGLVAEATGSGEQAARVLRKAQQRRPNDFWINEELAFCLATAETDAAQATPFFRIMVALRPRSPGARASLGNALLRQCISQASGRALPPPAPGSWINAGNGQSNKLLPNKEFLDGAIAEYREAIRLQDHPAFHYNLGLFLSMEGQRDEAMAEFREAIQLNKDFALAHNRLGNILREKKLLDEAIVEHQEAVRLNKNDADSHNDLGVALLDKGRLDDAIAECQEAIRLKEDHPLSRMTLGLAVMESGRLNEALPELRKAVLLNKDDAVAHFNLGRALRANGQVDEAIAEYREAVRLNRDFVRGHNSLGLALADKGHLDEAIMEYREAIRLDKDEPLAHFNLGLALRKKGELDQAITAFGEVIRLNKDDAEAHYLLGNIWRDKGRSDKAIAEFQQAIRIKEDYAEAHCNLGRVFQRQGQFRQALAELRRGHELGARKPRWPNPSAQWVRQCERQLELDRLLPGFLEGKITPAGAAERIELASLCLIKNLNRAAAHFYEAAVAADPKLAEDLRTQLRYNAACAAALAGCGQGKDVGDLDEKERARWRGQALTWLRADLTEWRKQLEGNKAKLGVQVQQTMGHWLGDSDFVGVRGPMALAKLREAERRDWEKLWLEAEELGKRAAQEKKDRSGKY